MPRRSQRRSYRRIRQARPELPVDNRPERIDGAGLALALVRRGLASPQILGPRTGR